MKILTATLLLVVILIVFTAPNKAPGVHIEPRVTSGEVEELEWARMYDEAVDELGRLWGIIDEAEVDAVFFETQGYRHWKSYREFRKWLWANQVDQMVYIPDKFDCEDFAFELSRQAMQDGYWVGIYVEDEHVQNIVAIGNTWYLVEPQTDGISKWLKDGRGFQLDRRIR